jgi:hypothetical protein
MVPGLGVYVDCAVGQPDIYPMDDSSTGHTSGFPGLMSHGVWRIVGCLDL